MRRDAMSIICLGSYMIRYDVFDINLGKLVLLGQSSIDITNLIGPKKGTYYKLSPVCSSNTKNITALRILKPVIFFVSL